MASPYLLKTATSYRREEQAHKLLFARYRVKNAVVQLQSWPESG
jgi:hypothetical protein